MRQWNTVRKTSLLLAFCLVCTVPVNGAYASSEESGLNALAQSFIHKISPKYKNVKVSVDPLAQIPNDSSLLLRPRSQKVVFDGEIYSFKRNNAVYMSLEDFTNLLELNVDFADGGLTGKGWFLREDWDIDIDIPAGKVISRGKTYKVNPNNIYEEDGIIFVRDTALEKWFGLSFSYDIEQQFVDIESEYPLPSVARNLRQNKSVGSFYSANEAVLPRVEQEKKMLDLNVVDLTLGTTGTKSSTGETTNRQTANVFVEGEALKHNAYLFSAADSDNSVTSVVSRLSKRSESPDLLGPLKARSYEIGDVSLTDIPLTGGVSQDLGFHFDNNPLENNDFATTDIEGDGLPGWDVELYRDGVLLDVQTITTEGRYEFNEIQLFLDDNEFELFFYGPQGEIRREVISVPVTRELLLTQDNTYEVSLSLEETQTYQKQLVKDVDEGAPHIAARYNKLLGDETLGYVGFRSRQLLGERKNFLSSGVSTIVGDAIVDTNFAIDDQANVAGEALVRQNIDEWNLSLRARTNSDEFSPDDFIDPIKTQISTNALRPLGNDGTGIRGSLAFNGLYQETVSGSVLQSLDAGLSQQFNRTNISNRLIYENNKLAGAADDEDLDYNLSLRRLMGPFFTRLGGTYNVAPDAELETLFGQVNYRRSQDFSTDFSVQHQLQNDLTTGRVNLNYINGKIRTSPFIEVNSEDRIYAGVNVNLSLIDPPYDNAPIVTSRRVIGRGMVSAHVYHDKNGNEIFDAGDEAIEGAIVESVNSRRREETNAQGYAVLKELTTTRPTDIVLDVDTLPDPFMISAFEGNSIFPDAGSIIEMEFPVHMSGEVDGLVYAETDGGGKQASTYHRVTLTSLDRADREVYETKSEIDGYYLMYQLPPGKYLLNVDKKRRGGQVYGNSVARIVTIGYEGTILSGTDIPVYKGQPYVPYQVVFESGAERYTSMPQYIMKVKSKGASKLSAVLNKLISRNLTQDMVKGLTRISDQQTSEGSFERYTDAQVEKLHTACADIITAGALCEIEVFIAHNNDEIAMR